MPIPRPLTKSVGIRISSSLQAPPIIRVFVVEPGPIHHEDAKNHEEFPICGESPAAVPESEKELQNELDIARLSVADARGIPAVPRSEDQPVAGDTTVGTSQVQPVKDVEDLRA